jgi:hypothetical protein
MSGRRPALAFYHPHGYEIVDPDPDTWNPGGDAESNPRRVWP